MKKICIAIILSTVCALLGIAYCVEEYNVDKAMASIAAMMVFLLAFALITILMTKPTKEG